jgi:hypothetical protein
VSPVDDTTNTKINYFDIFGNGVSDIIKDLKNLKREKFSLKSRQSKYQPTKYV